MTVSQQYRQNGARKLTNQAIAYFENQLTSFKQRGNVSFTIPEELLPGWKPETEDALKLVCGFVQREINQKKEKHVKASVTWSFSNARYLMHFQETGNEAIGSNKSANQQEVWEK